MIVENKNLEEKMKNAGYVSKYNIVELAGLYDFAVVHGDFVESILKAQFIDETDADYKKRKNKSLNLLKSVQRELKNVKDKNDISAVKKLLGEAKKRQGAGGLGRELRSEFNVIYKKLEASEGEIFKTRQVQDMIIFDRDDEFELVASKENLKVRNELSEAATSLGDSVEEVKNVINKKNTLLREDVFIKDNKKIILDLFDKLNSYISNVESMQKENIVEQKTVKFV